MKPKIAFISLIPDTGHIVPLLQLAAVFAESRFEVKCFFPEETIPLAKEFGIPIQSFGTGAASAQKAVLHKLSRRSVFYNAFSFYKDLKLHYFKPLTLAVAANLERIKHLLEEYGPALIIADIHLLQEYYLRLAGYLGKQLVFHASNGNWRYKDYHDHCDKDIRFEIRGKLYRYNYDRFIYNYGFTSLAPWLQLAVVWMGEFLNWACYCLTSWRLKAVNDYCNAILNRVFPGAAVAQMEPLIISTGLPFIEREITKEHFQSGMDLELFPPVRDHRKSEIAPSLREWLDGAGERPVVYICLGTMVQVNGRLIRKICRGLMGLDIFILWAAPAAQIRLIRKISRLPNLRLEEHVPQPRILALEKVRCFITHAGAGGVQDSLMNGKPVLCIPFMFDQPFNSSVAEMLGVGIRIWKNRVTAKLIHDSVRKLLMDPSYWNAAQETMKKLQGMDSGKEVIRFLFDSIRKIKLKKSSKGKPEINIEPNV
ncbi:MAG: glycosyltransferase [Firmicutes bacterium]|nr:glycosyltransferase [Bacillota bacterium]